MKTRICFIAIIVMCFLPGCKSSGGGTETETASGTPVTITAGTEAQVVAGNEWTDTIPKAAVSGVYKVVYTSKKTISIFKGRQ